MLIEYNGKNISFGKMIGLKDRTKFFFVSKAIGYTKCGVFIFEPVLLQKDIFNTLNSGC